MIKKELLRKIDVASEKVPRLYGHNEVNRDVLNLCGEVIENNVDGDFYEFGIYKGNITVLLGLLAKEYGRKVFAFDWFEGIKNFSEHDPKIKINPKVDLRGNGGDVRIAIDQYELEDVVTVVEGNIIDTIKQSDLSPASFVFMDVDLYEPTKSVLDAIYEDRLKMEVGAIIATHDYRSGWGGIDLAFDEFATKEGLEITRFDSTTAYVQKGRYGRTELDSNKKKREARKRNKT